VTFGLADVVYRLTNVPNTKTAHRWAITAERESDVTLAIKLKKNANSIFEILDGLAPIDYLKHPLTPLLPRAPYVDIESLVDKPVVTLCAPELN
jgi:hypothetical protein